MHLLLRCQMSSRHPWTLSSVGIWNVQDRRVNFYLRMSKLEATVLNVRARAQLSDDFDLSSVAPAHQEDSVQSGSLPCAKKCSSVLFSCMLLVREGWPQPATRCPRIKRKPDHLSTVDASLSLCGCYFGLARILGTGPVLR